MIRAIEALLEKAADIHALPDVYARLMRKLNEPEAPDGDLATIVSLDPVISSRLLRLANGA